MGHSFAEVCDYIIKFILFLLIIFTPLIYGSVQLLPLSILESAIFLIFILWSVGNLASGSWPSAKVRFYLPLLLFFLFVVLQFIPLPRFVVGVLSPGHLSFAQKFIPQEILSKIAFSLSICRGQTLFKIVELLSYALLFIVLADTLNSKKTVNRLVLAIIFMGFLIALLEMANQFRFPFVNRNHFAAYMELAIPLTVGYLFTGLIRPKKVIFSSVAIIMIVALFLSASRAGILCFLGSAGAMFFALKKRKTLAKKVNFLYLLLFCALVLFIILGLEPTLERFAILFKKDLISTEGRWTIWADTLKMITDFPLFGTGLGTFKNIYPMYRTLSVQATVSYAHSDFIQLVSECGLLGLGLSVWFLAMFFKDVFSLWLNRHNIFVKGITLGCLTGCLAILLHSFFDFSLQIPAIAFLFAIILALSYKCVLLRDDD